MASASASIEWQIPASRSACPAGCHARRPEPFQVGHARHIDLGLRHAVRNRFSAVSNEVRKHPPVSCAKPPPAGVVGTCHDVTSRAVRPRPVSGPADRPSWRRSWRSSSCWRVRAPGAGTPGVDPGVPTGRPGDLRAVGEHRTGVEATGDESPTAATDRGLRSQAGGGRATAPRRPGPCGVAAAGLAAGGRPSGAPPSVPPAVRPRQLRADSGIPLHPLDPPVADPGVLPSESCVFNGAGTDITSPLA